MHYVQVISGVERICVRFPIDNANYDAVQTQQVAELRMARNQSRRLVGSFGTSSKLSLNSRRRRFNSLLFSWPHSLPPPPPQPRTKMVFARRIGGL